MTDFVRFKFKSWKDFEVVRFQGCFISVSDLKSAIVKQKNLSTSADGSCDFDLKVLNAQTNEEYDADGQLIPKNSSVIVVRVPLPPGQRHRRPPQSVTQPMTVSPAPTAISLDVLNTSSSSEDQKIDAVIHVPIDSVLPEKRAPVRGGKFQRAIPPEGYICNRCHMPGHFIQHCATNGDPRYDKPKRLTFRGIPVNLLVKQVEYETGQFAIKPNEQKFQAVVSTLVPSSSELAVQVEESLKCPLCKKLLEDAVLLSCCQESLCDKCAWDHLINSNFQCPLCHKAITANEVVPNQVMRKVVDERKHKLVQQHVAAEDRKVKTSKSEAEAARTHEREVREKRRQDLSDAIPSYPIVEDTKAEDEKKPSPPASSRGSPRSPPQSTPPQSPPSQSPPPQSPPQSPTIQQPTAQPVTHSSPPHSPTEPVPLKSPVQILTTPPQSETEQKLTIAVPVVKIEDVKPPAEQPKVESPPQVVVLPVVTGTQLPLVSSPSVQPSNTPVVVKVESSVQSIPVQENISLQTVLNRQPLSNDQPSLSHFQATPLSTQTPLQPTPFPNSVQYQPLPVAVPTMPYPQQVTPVSPTPLPFPYQAAITRPQPPYTQLQQQPQAPAQPQLQQRNPVVNSSQQARTEALNCLQMELEHYLQAGHHSYIPVTKSAEICVNTNTTGQLSNFTKPQALPLAPAPPTTTASACVTAKPKRPIPSWLEHSPTTAKRPPPQSVVQIESNNNNSKKPRVAPFWSPQETTTTSTTTPTTPPSFRPVVVPSAIPTRQPAASTTTPPILAPPSSTTTVSSTTAPSWLVGGSSTRAHAQQQQQQQPQFFGATPHHTGISYPRSAVLSSVGGL
ncbi:zinc finger protein, RING/FYVE/PHD-type [Pelomyxa schiedti]|nr:zinc finger protein, RING/FYVE/PHD-type [Pelomyxa schiedti]